MKGFTKKWNGLFPTVCAVLLAGACILAGCDTSTGGGTNTPGGAGMDYNIGDTGPAGGIIFYASADGFTMTDTNTTAHYLEAAPVDTSSSARWASSDFQYTDIPGTEAAIGTGRKNTAVILATDTNAPAAKACNDLSTGEYTDWFLPSKDELDLMYTNLKKQELGSLQDSIYWSSSQLNYYDSWYQRFSSGYPDQDHHYKHDTYSVRGVRAF